MLMFRYFLIFFRIIIFVFGYMPSYRVGGFNYIISQVLIPVSRQGSILSCKSSRLMFAPVQSSVFSDLCLIFKSFDLTNFSDDSSSEYRSEERRVGKECRAQWWRVPWTGKDGRCATSRKESMILVS